MDMAAASNYMNPWCVDKLFEWAPRDQLNPNSPFDQHGGDGSSSVARLAVSSAAGATACGGTCPLSRPYCRAADGQCVLPTCASLWRACNKNSVLGLRVRLYCPQTCGCDYPRSPLALSTGDNGCPNKCTASVRFAGAMDSLPCADSPLSGNLTSFVDNYYSGSRNWPSSLVEGVDTVLRALRQWGCQYIAHIFVWSGPSTNLLIAQSHQIANNLCFGGVFPIKPIAFFCPVAFQCSSIMQSNTTESLARRQYCPPSCASWRPTP